MGRSDNLIKPFYNKIIKPLGEVALLGFSNNDWFKGDCYDISKKNWNINSKWTLPKSYDTIICTRCAYFAKDPEDFIDRCYTSLNDNGTLYVDWPIGDHWRFKNYKVGWVKNDEHEWAYNKGNYLWSTVWDNSFPNHSEYNLFQSRVQKFGYKEIEKAIKTEVPSIIKLDYIKKYFNVEYHMKCLWDDYPQLYILIKGIKI